MKPNIYLNVRSVLPAIETILKKLIESLSMTTLGSPMKTAFYPTCSIGML